MNVRIASVNDGYALRRIIAFDVFRWNLRLGFAIAPRDGQEAEQRQRLRQLRQLVPAYLHADIGLPPEEESPSIDMAIWHYLTR